MPSGLKYIYSNSVALTDPTAGFLKFDSVTLASVLSLRISDTDDDASNVTTLLQKATVGGWFVIQKDSNPSISALLQITDNRVGHTGWEEFPVVVKNINGSFTNGDVVRVIAAGAATLSLQSVTGPQGRNAGISYKFSHDLTATDPTAGFLKFDSATLASITQLYISNTDADANPLSALLARLDASTSSLKAIVEVRKNTDASSFLVFAVNAARTDHTGWKTFPITFVASNGSFADTDELRVAISLIGDKGTTGSAGSAGSPGAPGGSGGLSYVYRTTASASGELQIDLVSGSNYNLSLHPMDNNSNGPYDGAAGYFKNQAAKNFIVIQSVDFPSDQAFICYLNGAITEPGSFVIFPVTKADATPGFSDGENVSVQFSGPHV